MRLSFRGSICLVVNHACDFIFACTVAVALGSVVCIYSKTFLRNHEGTWNTQCTREFTQFSEMTHSSIISDASPSGRYQYPSFGSCLPTELWPFIVGDVH